MIWVWIAVGVISCVLAQKAWASWQWLDKKLDSFQGIAFIPEEKARELEQHLWGHG